MPGQPTPHTHQTDECPDHHHRCHATFHGYIDCPDVDHHPVKYKTKMLNVPCGAENPNSQIAAHLAVPANALDEVVQVLDLGHNGWLVILRMPI